MKSKIGGERERDRSGETESVKEITSSSQNWNEENSWSPPYSTLNIYKYKTQRRRERWDWFVFVLVAFYRWSSS